MDIGDLLSALPGIAAVIALILARRKNRADAIKVEEEAKKVKAETTEIIQRIATEQIEKSEKELKEKELECKVRIDELERDNKSIKAQMSVIKRDLKKLLIHYAVCVEERTSW